MVQHLSTVNGVIIYSTQKCLKDGIIGEMVPHKNYVTAAVFYIQKENGDYAKVELSRDMVMNLYNDIVGIEAKEYLAAFDDLLPF